MHTTFLICKQRGMRQQKALLTLALDIQTIGGFLVSFWFRAFSPSTERSNLSVLLSSFVSHVVFLFLLMAGLHPVGPTLLFLTILQLVTCTERRQPPVGRLWLVALDCEWKSSELGQNKRLEKTISRRDTVSPASKMRPSNVAVFTVIPCLSSSSQL